MVNKTVAKTGFYATNEKLLINKENYSHKRLLYGYTAHSFFSKSMILSGF